ncbi:radical SAM protein [Thermosipho ferrireducens]|uniref:Radical SAM protein n=1 Tax=Thermosipho ferrireducens TaxID=2571116 RepID=A0ABX7S9H1_9BACT|nr:radical SAM protein [Thermosipho ferrireducens]QTA38011.1 radical SAM protein [Thermosipho ferrireducens]
MKLSKYNLLIEKEDYIILFNVLSYAMLYVEPSKKDKIKKMFDRQKVDSGDFDESEIKTLKKGFFILENDFDEIEYLKFRFNAYKYSDRYLRYTVVMTEKCNFNCIYCYQQQLQTVIENSPLDLKEKQLKLLIDETKRRFEKQRPNVLSVTFYGGEPLLTLKNLLFLSENFKKLCEKYSVEYKPFIVTNGYLLTSEIADRLLNVGINRVIITIDGTEEIHDRYRKLLDGKPTFSKLIDNIEKIHKKMFVQIRINISKESINSVKKLIKLIGEKGLMIEFDFQMVEIAREIPIQFNDTPLTLKEFAKLEVELYKEILKYIPQYPFNPFRHLKIARCDALCQNSFVIDTDGSIHKCWGEVGNPITVVGQLSEEGIELNQKYAKWLTYEPYTDEECKNCIVFPVCMGGCTFNAVVVDKLHGSPIKKPYRCIPLKYNLKEMVELTSEKLKTVRV